MQLRQNKRRGNREGERQEAKSRKQLEIQRKLDCKERVDQVEIGKGMLFNEVTRSLERLKTVDIICEMVTTRTT